MMLLCANFDVDDVGLSYDFLVIIRKKISVYFNFFLLLFENKWQMPLEI